MAKKKKKKSNQGPAPEQGQDLNNDGLFTPVDRMLNKQQKALDNGKYKKAARIGKRVVGKVRETPEYGIGAERSLAEEEFSKNVTYNRPDQQAIGGSQTYEFDPTTGKYTVKQSLDQGQQGLYDQSIANRSAANQAFSNAFGSGVPYGQAYDFSTLPAAPQADAAERSRIEKAQYDRITGASGLENRYAQQKEELRSQLISQGADPRLIDSDPRMQALERNFTSERDQATNTAVATGGEEMSRSFNLGSQARSNALGEMFAQRQQPMNELGFLAGLGGGPTALPNFFNFQPIQYQGPDYLQYLQTGIQNQQFGQNLQLQRDQMAQQAQLQAQALAAAGSGGGGQSFSLGGFPSDSQLPAPSQGGGDPAATNFGAGFVGGSGIALKTSPAVMPQVSSGFGGR